MDALGNGARVESRTLARRNKETREPSPNRYTRRERHAYRLGTVFVAGVTLDQALDLLQDYDRHAEIYRPAVARSKLVSRDADVFRVDLRSP
jgi:hypothetical protein